MMKVLNILLVCAVVGVAIWLYELKYGVRASVAEIAQAKREIAQLKQDLTLLRAEWSHLTRPNRLQELAVRHLELERVQSAQIIGERDIAATIPERVEPEPEYPADDPIGNLLQIEQ